MLSEKKEGFTGKKIPAQAVSEKKFVQAENPPPPPHHFSNGPSLKLKRWEVNLIGKVARK